MIDSAIAEVACRQCGLFSRAQLPALGGTRHIIHRRLAAGRWVRLEPGVYSLPGWPKSWRRSLWLAHLDAGPHSVVSHEAAAGLHGLLHYPAGAVHLIIPHPDHHRGPKPNNVHQSRDLKPEHLTTIDGLPVTTIARTFCDLAATSGRGRITRAIEDAHITRRCAIPAVHALARDLSRPGKPGLGWLTAALAERGPGWAVPESVLEAKLLKTLRAGGFHNIKVQHELPWRPHAPNRVDMLLDDRIIVEADSRRWHGRLDAMAEDRRRDRDAQLHGYPLYRFLYEEVIHDAEAICSTLRRAQAQAQAPRHRTAA